MYEYKAVVVNIVDGDTFDVEIDLGFHITLKERIRVLYVDTPEKKGEEKELGIRCTEFAKFAFLNKECIVRTQKTDSFGRWLAEVVFTDEKTGEKYTLHETYNALGINKKCDTYTKENVLSLKYIE